MKILALSKEQALALVACHQRMITEMDRYICAEEFGEENVEEWEGPSEADVVLAKTVERDVRIALGLGAAESKEPTT